MLKDKLDSLIGEAMKSGDKARLNTLRMIKNSLTLTKEEMDNKVVESEEREFKVLTKMKKTYANTADEYDAVGFSEHAEDIRREIKVIEEFLPKEASDEDIIKLTKKIINDDFGGHAEMKDMRAILQKVQAKYPTANGKIVSAVVRGY